MNKKPFSDMLEGGGIRFERHGRFAKTENLRSGEEHREAMRQRAEYHKALPEQIKNKTIQLEGMISQYDPLDVMANLLFIHGAHDPNTYQEPQATGNPAYVEYAALLCLKKPRWSSGKRMLGREELEPIDSQLRDIYSDALTYYGTESVDPHRDEPGSALEEMRFLTLINELIVRFPGYDWHVLDVAEQVLKPVNDWIETELGFTIQQAIDIARAVGSVMMAQFWHRRDQAREQMKELRRNARAARGSKSAEKLEPGTVVAELAAMSEKDMLRATKNISAAWLFFALGDTLLFGPEDIANEANIPVASVTRFLELFSLRFGDCPDTLYIPTPTHELRTRPVIRDSNRFFCTSPQALFWAIRPRIEEVLNPARQGSLNRSQRLWEKYVKTRADFLEGETVRLLRQVLPSARVEANLSYRSGNGSLEGELDVLVLFDRLLMLVEAKAGAVRPSARRGGQQSMLESVRQLIGSAHEQALHARDYIASVDGPLFVRPDGTEYRLDKDSYDEVLMITITLEEVSVFSPILHEVAKTGIFSSSELPWAVPYFDFRVICETIEFSSQFVHFLKRRRRLGELGLVVAHDELDYFGHYLAEGLFFDDLGATDLNRVQLLSYTTVFDDYYSYQMGYRSKPASRPRQKIPVGLMKIIKDLEERQPSNYVAVICSLLDLDDNGRRFFARSIEKLNRKAAKDKKTHDFSIMYRAGEERRGLTAFVSAAIHPNELHKRLAAYCVIKKYREHASEWLGLGRVLELPGSFHVHVVVSGEWEFDAKLEEILEGLPRAEGFALTPRPRGARADTA